MTTSVSLADIATRIDDDGTVLAGNRDQVHDPLFVGGLTFLPRFGGCLVALHCWMNPPVFQKLGEAVVG